MDVTEVVDTLGPDMFPDCDMATLPRPRRLYMDVSPNDALEDLMGTEFFSVTDGTGKGNTTGIP